MLTLNAYSSTQIGTTSGFTVTEIPGLGPVAIPQTAAQLGEFLALQRAINAAIRKHQPLGSHLITVDGRLGPSTRIMHNLVAGFIPGMQSSRSITSLGSDAEAAARTIAAAVGASYDASVPARMRTATTSVSPPAVHVMRTRSRNRKTGKWIAGLAVVAGLAAIGIVTYRRNRV